MDGAGGRAILDQGCSSPDNHPECPLLCHMRVSPQPVFLWTVGNYGMLLLVGELGTGKGYTIAQLSVVVNALMGI